MKFVSSCTIATTCPSTHSKTSCSVPGFWSVCSISSPSVASSSSRPTCSRATRLPSCLPSSWPLSCSSSCYTSTNPMPTWRFSSSRDGMESIWCWRSSWWPMEHSSGPASSSSVWTRPTTHPSTRLSVLSSMSTIPMMPMTRKVPFNVLNQFIDQFF